MGMQSIRQDVASSQRQRIGRERADRQQSPNHPALSTAPCYCEEACASGWYGELRTGHPPEYHFAQGKRGGLPQLIGGEQRTSCQAAGAFGMVVGQPDDITAMGIHLCGT